MKVQSNEQLPDYQVSGQELRIHWDAQEITTDGMGGPVTYWEQSEALCGVADSRGQIISAIIRSVFSIDAELATINNQADKPDEYAAYQAFRAQAKELADGWLNK